MTGTNGPKTLDHAMLPRTGALRVLKLARNRPRKQKRGQRPTSTLASREKRCQSFWRLVERELPVATPFLARSPPLARNIHQVIGPDKLNPPAPSTIARCRLAPHDGNSTGWTGDQLIIASAGFPPPIVFHSIARHSVPSQLGGPETPQPRPTTLAGQGKARHADSPPAPPSPVKRRNSHEEPPTVADPAPLP